MEKYALCVLALVGGFSILGMMFQSSSTGLATEVILVPGMAEAVGSTYDYFGDIPEVQSCLYDEVTDTSTAKCLCNPKASKPEMREKLFELTVKKNYCQEAEQNHMCRELCRRGQKQVARKMLPAMPSRRYAIGIVSVNELNYSFEAEQPAQ